MDDDSEMDKLIAELSRRKGSFSAPFAPPIPNPLASSVEEDSSSNFISVSSRLPNVPDISVNVPLSPEKVTAPEKTKNNSTEANDATREKIKKQFLECPSWALQKIRDEILKRREIEDKWEATNKKVEKYLEDLRNWKKTVVAQIESQRAKNYDHLMEIQNASNTEINSLKLLLHKKDQEIKEKNELIRQRELQISKLMEQVQRGSRSDTRSTSPEPSRSSPPAPVGEEIVKPNTAADAKVVSWLGPNAKSEALIEILFSEDKGYILITAISEVATGKIQEDLVKSVLQLMDAHGESMRLFETVISKEIDKTKGETTLFRANSFASKLMTYFTTVAGIQYLSEILKPIVQEVIDKGDSYEVDPNKSRPDEDLVANMKKLSEISQKFINIITGSIDKCPAPFREVCYYLITEVSKKFPEDSLAGVKNFIFLRYICPAILNPPKEFGFGEIKETPRRTLVLVSKILQNVVNGVDFKESYMKGLNPFIAENSDKVQQFLKKLGDVKPSGSKQPILPNSVANIKESIRLFVSSVSSTREPLIEKLRAFDSQVFNQNVSYKTTDRMINTALDIGMPNPKKGKRTPLVNEDAKTQSLVSLFVEENDLNLEIVDILSTEKDKEKIAQALVQVLSAYSHKSVTNLITSVALKEVINADSITNRLLSNYCQILFPSTDYMKDLSSVLIEDLSDGKDDLKANNDALMEQTNKFLNQVIKMLNNMPGPLVEIFTNIFRLSNSTKASSDKVVRTMLLGILVPILENTEQFGVATDSVRKKIKKPLQLMADVIRSIASGSDEKDPRMIQFVAKRYDSFIISITDWLGTSPTANLKDVPLFYTSWTNIEEKLSILFSFLCDKMQILSGKLGTSGSTKVVTVKMSDLIENLVVNASRNDQSKSSVF